MRDGGVFVRERRGRGVVAVATKADLTCLKCVLFDCDEDSPQCLYQIARTRKEYYADYYRANREAKIAAAKQRNNANPRDASYYREYRARRKLAKA